MSAAGLSSRLDDSTLPALVAELPRRGKRRALGYFGQIGVRWWSYARLHTQILRMAALLAQRGIGSGDRILLWAPNQPEWGAVFLAASIRGASTVLVDAQQPLEFVRTVLAEARPKLIIHGVETVPTDGGEEWLSLATAVFQAALASVGERLEVAVQPDDEAVVIYSSGTTGGPKGVVLSHRNLMTQLQPFGSWRAVLRILPFRALSLTPLSHVLGLVVGFLLPLSIGLPTVYTAVLEPVRWARIVRDHRISVVIAVPRVLGLLMDFVLTNRAGGGPTLADRLAQPGRLRHRMLTFWRRGQVFGRFLFRVVLVGGAELPKAIEDFWRRAGIVVVQGYGLTETAAFVSVSHPFRRSGTVGRPLEDQEIRITPEGELLVRGSNLSPGYLGPGELDLTPDGFLRTGDLVRRGESGRLIFLGRKKEVIVTSEGFNVYPARIEAILERHDGVRDCAVVPGDSSAGEEVLAVLSLRPGVEADEVVRCANRQLPADQRIRSWTVWPGDRLPRNSMHKLRRHEVVRWLKTREPTNSPPALPETRAPCPSSDEILRESDRARRLKLVVRYLTAEGGESMAADLRLVADLGLSSLDVVEVVEQLERIGGSSLGRPPAIGSETTLGQVRSQLRTSSEGRGAAAVNGAVASSSAAVARLPARQPRWALNPFVRLLRALTRGLVITCWTALGYRPIARWHCDPASVERPFVLVAKPHRHWLDAFVIYRALPRALRRRVMVVTNRDFHQFFSPRADTPLSQRWVAAGAYYLVLPLLFCFSILPSFGRTREGLLETARLIGRRYSPICFPVGLAYYGRPEPWRHDPGMAWLALETGAVLLPVMLEGTIDLGWRWRRSRQPITVHFGEPIRPAPSDRPDTLVARVEAAWTSLAADRGPGHSGSHPVEEV